MLDKLRERNYGRVEKKYEKEDDDLLKEVIVNKIKLKDEILGERKIVK